MAPPPPIAGYAFPLVFYTAAVAVNHLVLGSVTSDAGSVVLPSPALWRIFMHFFIIAVTLLIHKSAHTVYHRLASQAFRNKEDYVASGVTPPSQLEENEQVERVRRAHLNDIEFFVVAFPVALVFIASSPSILAAQVWLYGAAALRVLHTVAYLLALGFRGPCWFFSTVCVVGMLGHSVAHAFL